MGCLEIMNRGRLRRLLLASAATLVLVPAGQSLGQDRTAPASGAAAVASDVADFFGQVGDQIYEEDCIFELSPEQLEVQQALIQAYIKQGASSSLARQLAVKQIHPPTLSEKCRQIKSVAIDKPWIVVTEPPVAKKPTVVAALPKLPSATPAPTPLADRKVLPQWDCDPGVDYVTI